MSCWTRSEWVNGRRWYHTTLHHTTSHLAMAARLFGRYPLFNGTSCVKAASVALSAMVILARGLDKAQRYGGCPDLS